MWHVRAAEVDGVEDRAAIKHSLRCRSVVHVEGKGEEEHDPPRPFALLRHRADDSEVCVPGDEAIVRVDEVGNEDHHGASVPLYGLRTLLSQANLARHSCQIPSGFFSRDGRSYSSDDFSLFF